MVKDSETKKKEKTFNQKDVYKMTIQNILIFGIPAVIAAFLGNFIDKTFEIQPYGSLAILGIFFTISWISIIRFNLLARNIK